MNPTFFDQMAQFNRMAYEPLLQLQGIGTRFWGEISRQSIESMNQFCNNAQEQMQTFTHAKGFEDIVRTQSQFATECSNSAMNQAQQFLDVCMETATEYKKCCSQLCNTANQMNQHSNQGKAQKAGHEQGHKNK